MDSKEEKKERRQGYFARLKKKRQAKQIAEPNSANSHVSSASTQKDDALKVILGHITEKDSEEEKKKKRIQVKPLRRGDIKRCSTGENQTKNIEKKEKKMVTRKPPGTIVYTASGTDTLNCIALKFNITPNKLVELNKLFTQTIVPGQVLYVPDGNLLPSDEKDSKANHGVLVSPLSSDAEFDKLSDADLVRKATKPIERVMSSTSEEEEPIVVKFLKMNCRYITDGKGVVGGVMIVTPNNIMFDPHKSDPLVIENGCEEYGLICPMEEVVSFALYNDISHMKLKDALPSPGQWEDLSSEKDINPFSKFKSLNKERRQQNGVNEVTSVESETISPSNTEMHEELKLEEVTTEPEQNKDKPPVDMPTVQLNIGELIDGLAIQIRQSAEITTSSETKKADHSPVEDFELVESLEQQNTTKICKAPIANIVAADGGESNRSKSFVPHEVSEVQEGVEINVSEEKSVESLSTINMEGTNDDTCTGLSILEIPQMPNKTKNIQLCHSHAEERTSQGLLMSVSVTGKDATADKTATCISLEPKQNSKVATTMQEITGVDKLAQSGQKASDESLDSLSPSSPEDPKQKETQLDSESELKLWLLKRIQGPIEDMLPSKEEKSKIPPMFLCVKVGKPMRKSFATHSAAMVQHYARKRKQPEYWFAVPQERVDHLYTFFVQWSPEVYGKDAKDQGFVVVEKDELDMIDNFFSEPSTKSWEIITVEEAKRRKSTCSYNDYEEEAAEDYLPDLKDKSSLLDDTHVEKLAHCLPARVQGYPWHLLYSTQEHGTSLKTLYRNLASLDSPVLLVVKDMDNQVFGAYATHPFRLSDHYYGTGETFLFTFSPDFKVFKWSGENSYFINGDISFLELGGGGGRFGLWLDSDLYHGRSNSCRTFNNDSLSKKEDFIVQDVEVWAFE
ncbi:nuclear receptor coactivator 7 isoform X3 [Ascaphus truei]|uniref:nuclear receptor coactivator 7 isoform X3 n=1 Tax=Ascaphus truei TaxID=8439 RepID=UPI003F5931CC